MHIAVAREINDLLLPNLKLLRDALDAKAKEVNFYKKVRDES